MVIKLTLQQIGTERVMMARTVGLGRKMGNEARREMLVVWKRVRDREKLDPISKEGDAGQPKPDMQPPPGPEVDVSRNTRSQTRAGNQPNFYGAEVEDAFKDLYAFDEEDKEEGEHEEDMAVDKAKSRPEGLPKYE